MLTVEQIARIIRSTVHVTHDDDGVLHKVDEAAQKVHDLCKPDHTIHVAAAALEAEVTDTLLNMTVATVLAALIEQEGGGRTNFAFSPMQMADISTRWTWDVERDGMVRTVRIQPKDAAEFEEADGDLLAHSALAKSMSRAATYENADEDFVPPADPESDIPVQPQARVHEYNRPVWAVRVCLTEDDGPYLQQVPSQRAAAEYVRTASEATIATVENRWCMHLECPSTGCMHDASLRDSAEATSDEES